MDYINNYIFSLKDGEINNFPSKAVSEKRNFLFEVVEKKNELIGKYLEVPLFPVYQKFLRILRLFSKNAGRISYNNKRHIKIYEHIIMHNRYFLDSRSHQ